MNGQAEERKRAPRRDAQRRREALLTAATSCFQEFGHDVPLEVVADRAGVGRGTLYRNFKDRDALVLAIFSREMDRFEDTFDLAEPIETILDRMVREGAPVAALYRRIAADLHQSDASLAAFEALRERLERLIAPAVQQAHERGELAEELTPAELVLAMQMAGGLLYPFMSDDEITAQISAALKLLLGGMRPR